MKNSKLGGKRATGKVQSQVNLPKKRNRIGKTPAEKIYWTQQEVSKINSIIENN